MHSKMTQKQQQLYRRKWEKVKWFEGFISDSLGQFTGPQSRSSNPAHLKPVFGGEKAE